MCDCRSKDLGSQSCPSGSDHGPEVQGFVSGVWASAAPGLRLRAYEVTFLRIRVV